MPISETFNQDCVNYIKALPDNFFDLAFCDIEYGIGASKPSKKPNKAKQKNGTILNVKTKIYTPKEWDFKKQSAEYFTELFRVSKNQIIFGGNYYGLQGGYLVWDKLNGSTDQYGCELAWLSFTQRTDIVYFLWSGMFQGVYCGKNVREALIQQGNKQLNETRIHETQKPVSLYKWALNEYSEKLSFKNVFDSHMGSQSLRIACYDMGIDFYGTEIDEEHYINGCSRFEDFKKQLKLF